MRAFKSENGEIDQEVLLLDAECTEYPYVSRVPDFDRVAPWGIFRVSFVHPQHFLVIELKRQLAYAVTDSGAWDVLDQSNIPVTQTDLFEGPDRIIDSEAGKRYQLWQGNVAHPERAELVTITLLPLERVVGILESGDVVHKLPILYIQADSQGRLISAETKQRLEFTSWTHQYTLNPDPKKRVPFFQNLSKEENALDSSSN
ncbi:hypothetical protein [Deinococcus sp. Leaf326]|uniref:hypothetical protein n=1 Tax=Deinococcus sp. Leaf326 TaxID=1736338 RepID=UPI000A4D1548|nr:hypothetical protein [Deinococcus sp. Leaf326]